jgi:tRNA A-37 threonylcarbamoyl transferase component Bud32/tetratricopeptide (TPR) repeat protein
VAEALSCPSCGARLSDGAAPGGLCPRCLLQAGLGTPTVDFAKTPPRTAPPPRNGPAPPAPDPAELAPLFPHLEILELVGQGGMGVVYKARQPRLDRLVALKVLTPQGPDAADFAERFAREARALARLSHSSIVTIHDFGQAGQLCYFIMEYVDGLNLRQALRSGTLSPAQALAIVPQVCDALQYAHNEGIVHRDIKPENILLDRKGRVKIADFGLAKLLGRAAAEVNLTGPLHVMGTPLYMAPEQMQRPLEVDHRADIYSLGVVFYEMLTGELPLGRFAPPSEKVQIDVRLDEVVLKSLAREPDRRYQQASEIKSRVESIASSPPAPAGAGIPGRAAKRRAVALLGAAAIMTLAALGGLIYHFSGTAAPGNPPSANPAKLNGLLGALLDPQGALEEKEKVWGKIKQAGLLDRALSELEWRARDNAASADLQAELGGGYIQKIREATTDMERGTLAIKADRAFDTALSIDPNHWWARFEKAMALTYWPAVFGKRPAAIREFETLIKQQEGSAPQPHFTQSYLYLGNLLLEDGKRERALEVWKKGQSLFPSDPELNQRLAEVESRSR